MKKYKVVAAGMFLSVGIAQAAVISWGGVMNYSSANEVSNEGLLVEAVNACGSGKMYSPLINGVPFTARTDLMTDDASPTFFYGDTGDSGYNDLLDTLDFGTNDRIDIGAGLLEAGKEYMVQVWFVDERGNYDGRAMQFGDGHGNLSGQVNDQYVTGTFTADGAFQTLVISGVSSGPHITAYQVRDLNSPVPTLSTAAGSTVSGSYTVSIGFTESVSGLTASDFDVVNGTASGVAGSGASWSVTITPVANGDVTVSLPAGSVTSGSGTTNVEGNSLVTTYVAAGSEQPVPTLSVTNADVYATFPVQVEFSEPVTGLVAGDFDVTGGTASSLTGAGSSYTLMVTPVQGGDVDIQLPANSATDTDGDNLKNVASTVLVVNYFVTVTVSSPAELLPYMTQDNINATLAPGTYTITSSDVSNTFGTPRFVFEGSNSTYDFTGVTINFAADVYTDNHGMDHLQILGNNNVLKNLTMVDLINKNVTNKKNGGTSITMDGSHNRIEGFHMTISGSYPYGYGDCFGKGGANTIIGHKKHSALLVRGESNHVLNCTLIHRSYGHAIFMQAANNPRIEGCYVEGEMRTTDDMLAEEGTGSPADNVDFMTTWGYRLPPGYIKCTGEEGIRAYNGGTTYIDGVTYERGTSNPTIINNTIVNMRAGVTLTHATGTKYVSGCTAIGCERGYAIGRGIIENCAADAKHGPAFGVDYETDSGITADITILPYEGTHYNGSRHLAYIYGNNHNLTFRGLEQSPDQTLEIDVGGDKRIIGQLAGEENYVANSIVINNLSGYPIVLDDAASSITGQTIGPEVDLGSANAFTTRDWSITNNLAFRGTVTQSSTTYDAIAALATDQNTSGVWSEGSVTQTQTELKPWWQIDLGHDYALSEVRVWGRTDASQSRLSNYDVTVLDAAMQPVWTSYQSSFPAPMVSLATGAVTGRYVKVQLRGFNPLSLAEVEIFGTSAVEELDFAVATHSSSNAPSVRSNDLAQTYYASSSATGDNEAAEHAQLFNGLIGNEDSDTSDVGEVRLDDGNTVTVTLDTSVHTNGFELTGINTYFGWDPLGGGRANQGYEVILTYIDGSTETLAGPAHWEPNSPAAYWTTVSFTDPDGGAMASNVKAVTFDITQNANAGGIVIAREFDLLGYPVQPPETFIPTFLPGATAVSNGQFTTAFSGVLGADYVVEWTDHLTNSNWRAVTNTGPMEKEMMELSVLPTNQCGFYRARWNP